MTLREEIDSLNPWFYDFELSGEPVVSGIYPGRAWDATHERLVVRQAQRRTLLVDAVAERVPLVGRTLTDVACNCAFWSSLLMEHHGVEYVFGIEGRELHVRQAELVFREKGLDGDFLHANVLEVPGSHFRADIILCAGLLYHVPDPLSFVGTIGKRARETLLIDTRTAPKAITSEEPVDRCFNSLPWVRRTTIPTAEGVVSAMEDAGFAVEVVPPGWEFGQGCIGLDDYHHGRRMFAIGRRR